MNSIFSPKYLSTIGALSVVVVGSMLYGSRRKIFPEVKMATHFARNCLLRYGERAVARIADRSLVPLNASTISQVQSCLVTREAIKKYYVEQIHKATCLMKRGDFRKSFVHVKKASVLGGHCQTLKHIRAVVPPLVFAHLITEARVLNTQPKSAKREKHKLLKWPALETIDEADE